MMGAALFFPGPSTYWISVSLIKIDDLEVSQQAVVRTKNDIILRKKLPMLMPLSTWK